MTGAIDERDVSDKFHSVSASWAFTGWVVFLVGAVGTITAWSWAGFVFTFINLNEDKSIFVSHVEMEGRCTIHTFALAYPSLMVIFRTSSFLNRTVITPDIAFTTVDFP